MVSSQKVVRRRMARLLAGVEKLEDRLLLTAAGLNVFAVQHGEIPEDGNETIAFRVDAAAFSFSDAGQKVTLGFQLGPLADGELIAAPISIVDSAGRQVRQLSPHSSTTDARQSVVLAELSAGDYQLVLDGLLGSYGEYELRIMLAGDANGDLNVDKADDALIKSLFRAESTDNNYLSSADVNLDGRIDGFDHSIARRNRGAGILALAPLEFEVDPSLTPRAALLPPLVEGGEPRRAATLVDESGIPVDFIEDELLVMSDDDAMVADLAARWNGQVVKVIDASEYGVDGMKKLHVLKVDTSATEIEKLPVHLKQLDGNARGLHKVSSESGLKLLAVASREAAVSGIDIGIVWISEPTTFRDRESNEAPSGPQNPDLTAYDRDAFTWTHLADGSVQDIGTTEAWRALEIAGKLDNKIKTAVIDGGFTPDADWPAGWNAISLVLSESSTNSPGSDDKPWHGQKVMSALAAQPDNDFGAAGSGGPVVDAVAIHAKLDFVSSIVALLSAQFAESKIINMSFSARVPASLSFSVLPFDVTTRLVRASGTLLFAAAGNDSQNVDAEDCFLFCWEKAWHAPVENGGVTGVGGLAPNSLNRASGSNWGPEEVDIFAPYTVWVGPDPSSPGNIAQSVSGTSVSSPYAAGVAALIWAANPSLRANQVEQVLMSTARPSPDGRVNRVVNAYDAVIAVLGDVPPVIDIVTPLAGQTYSHSTSVPLLADVDDVEGEIASVTWISNLDGWSIASGASTSASLSIGTHVLTAVVEDAVGQTASDTVTVTIVNDPPIVNILQPEDGATFFVGQRVQLSASSFDINGTSLSLSDSAIRWSSSIDGYLGTGHDIRTSWLSAGTHQITVTGTDPQGAVGADSVTIVLVNPIDPVPVVWITQPSMSISRTFDGFDDVKEMWYLDVTLFGAATDEGNPLTGSALVWRTDRDDLQSQILGTGSSLTVRLYMNNPFGTAHLITLTATDLSGQSVSASVQITIAGLA